MVRRLRTIALILRFWVCSFCGGVLEQTKKQFPQHTNWAVEHHTDTWHEAFKGKQDSLVYLTADAPEQIDTLERDCMYVVGGIVDRNRYPQLCYNKAQELGVRTAKLPIGEYLKLTGSRVCTRCMSDSDTAAVSPRAHLSMCSNFTVMYCM